MALANIQLCHMDALDRAAGRFSVTVHSEAGDQFATFHCSSERAAHDLRNAIRDNADSLHRVADYRDRSSKPALFSLPAPDPAHAAPSAGTVPWLIFRRGRVLDTVYFTPSCTADEIRRGLIEHDGLPADIAVCRRAPAVGAGSGEPKS